jgi:putative transcriptional regulator
MTHPNRSKLNRRLGANPTPLEVRAAREKAGLTAKQAGQTIFKSLRAWQAYELGERVMSAADFCLFLLVTDQADLEQIRAASLAERQSA